MSAYPHLSDKEVRRLLTSKLIVDEALPEGDERYEPLYEGVENDAVDLLFEDITLSEIESLNFFSGFRGAGKTTELFRLKKMLEDECHFVAYADALDLVLPAEPVHISDFLIVLAGGFSDAVEKELGVSQDHESFWNRFMHFLAKTKAQVDGFNFEATIPGTKMGLNFKTTLKQESSFRAHLRQKLSGRLGELRAEVHAFFADARKRIREERGEDVGIVFLFDQFEQLRDTLDTEGRVADSVTRLLANHRRDLAIPYTHLVYTVPPWIKFKLPELRSIRFLYNVKLWNNDAERSRCEEGFAVMRRMVERRFEAEGLMRFFGPAKEDGTRPLVDELIHASGGHFRDLVFLLRETVLRVRELPATEVGAAIRSLRDSYLPISIRDARLLDGISQSRTCNLADDAPETILRLTLFLDTRCALILRNGDDWYDIHPLLREEVEAVLSRARKEPQPVAATEASGT